jgi:hypothetical protein
VQTHELFGIAGVCGRLGVEVPDGGDNNADLRSETLFKPPFVSTEEGATAMTKSGVYSLSRGVRMQSALY